MGIENNFSKTRLNFNAIINDIKLAINTIDRVNPALSNSCFSIGPPDCPTVNILNSTASDAVIGIVRTRKGSSMPIIPEQCPASLLIKLFNTASDSLVVENFFSTW